MWVVSCLLQAAVFLGTRSPPIVGQAKRRTTKIRPKAIGSGIFGRFPNCDQFRSEVADDAISGVTVDYFDTDVHATNIWCICVKLWLNYFTLAGQTRFAHHFCPVFNCILQPTGSNYRRYIRPTCGASYTRQPCEIW